MKKHTFILFCLLVISSTSHGQNIDELDKNQPVLETILKWNDQIIVEIPYYDRTFKNTSKAYLVCDDKSNKLVPLHIDTDKIAIELAETKTHLYAIVQNGNTFSLLKRKKSGRKKWESETINIPFELGWNSRLLTQGNDVFLIDQKNIYYRKSSNNWISTSLKELLGDSYPLYPEITSLNAVISKNCITLGYEGGEWGSNLIQILYSGNRDIMYKEVKNIGTTSRNVVKYDKSLLLCGSFPSFNSYELMKYENEKLITLISSQDNNKLKFAKAPGEIVCTVDGKGDIYVATGYTGIFRVTNDSLINIMDSPLCLSYSKEPNYIIVSSPQAMLMVGTTFYIATRSLGVFVYTKTDKGYSFKQLAI